MGKIEGRTSAAVVLVAIGAGCLVVYMVLAHGYELSIRGEKVQVEMRPAQPQITSNTGPDRREPANRGP